MEAARDDDLSARAFGVYWVLRENAALKAAGLDAMTLAKECEEPLGRFPNATVNADEWGSCSSACTVTLARDLVDQEARFQDYVIVHELLHLRLPTHGRLFKALMSAYVPGWQAMEGRRPRLA
jgi:predicted metal-dependent hydrolase